MDNYYLLDENGGEYSANPGDYWDYLDGEPMNCALVKRQHPYITVTGKLVYADRVLKSWATIDDLRRLGRVVYANA